jgi:outer membrane protein assembly factor BamB
VSAFRASDGGLIWRRDGGAPAAAPPSLAADRVYVAMTDHRILALHVASGEPVWEQRVAGQPGDILALDDRIYVGADDDYFYCLLAGSGRVDWAWRAGADIVGRGAADHDRVYFTALDNVLRALDRRTGNQRWMRSLPLRPGSGPVVAADTVFVRGVGSVVRAYGARNGEPAGELPVDGDVVAGPHLAAGTPLPMIVITARSLQQGATVRAFIRSIEPETAPAAPLPDLVRPPLPD